MYGGKKMGRGGRGKEEEKKKEGELALCWSNGGLGSGPN